MTYSKIWKRAIAAVTDILIIIILSGYFIYTGIWYFPVLLAALYFIIFEGSKLQATPGKILMGIRVSDINGIPIGYCTSFVRNVLKIISVATVFVGFIMAYFDDNNQALHDRLAKTLVIGSTALKLNNREWTENRQYVLCLCGEFAGKRFPMESGSILFGRDRTSCQIVFAENTKDISRYHCTLFFNEPTRIFILTDIGSTNGTYISNGIRISKGNSAYLNSGDKFFLGNKDNMFEVIDVNR